MLTSKQRAILRKEAQALPVVFQVGIALVLGLPMPSGHAWKRK